MRPDPYWLATAPAFSAESPLPIEGRSDVAVVGGGFTGLSAALALARNGIAVRLLEARTIAAEASGRNGGHCNNGLALDICRVAARFGIERAREMYRAYDAGVDLIEALVKREGIDCDFRRSGKLKLAAKPHHLEAMKRTQAMLAREVDADTAILEKSELAAEIGSPRFSGGLLQRRSAAMHMGRFAAGLAEAAARAGAVIHQDAAVTAIARRPKGFSLVTRRGTIEASEVVVATGVSRTGPFGWLRRRIVPVGSFVIVTEPLSGELARAIMPGRRNCTTSRHIGNYFRMTADNRLVFGGRARFAMSNPTSDLKSGAILRRQLGDVFPQIANVRIDHCWGGLVDMTRDRLPRSGSREGMRYAVGYSGHGVQMSVLMGHLMARRIVGEDVADPWRDLPWQAVPLHFGTPWFLPLVGLYYRALDHWH
jgi:glycine/D-amino acid oxidase-like deaminating enzyme